MALTIGIGNEAYSAADALIIPANVDLILRGTHGKYIMDRLGEPFQAELMKSAPLNPGQVIRIPSENTDYQMVYAVAAFPYQSGSVSWTSVQEYLQTAIQQAINDGWNTIAVPLFQDDGSYGDAPVLLDINQSLYANGTYMNAAEAMMNVAYSLSSADLLFMPVNALEENMMNIKYNSVFFNPMNVTFVTPFQPVYN